MGCINAVFAPFIILYLLFYSFFRYFEVSRCVSRMTGLLFLIKLNMLAIL